MDGNRDRARSGEGRPSQGRPGDGRPAERRTPGGSDVPSGPADSLENWIVDALSRVTSPENTPGALTALGKASAAFREGRFAEARDEALRGKALAPRDATVREVLGLAAYRLGEWDVALRELRTYRRLAGDDAHLPVEMDVQRAIGRDDGVERTWAEINERVEDPFTRSEGLVVYASYLLDRGRISEARAVATPDRLRASPDVADLRRWYVAARAAALDGDIDAARELRDAVGFADPSFPGLDELDALLLGSG